MRRSRRGSSTCAAVLAIAHYVSALRVSLASRRLQLLTLGLEQIVEAVLGELDAGREPEIAGRLHVMKDAAQRERAARPSDDVGMHRERDVFRVLRAILRIKLVEIGLPGLEPMIRVAVLAMAVAEQRAVAEWLPRQFHDYLAVVLVEERQLLVEA